jgi:hypothetical protein
MSPFAIAAILILSFLFAVLSFAPVLFGSSDVDSFDAPQQSKTKPAH